MYDLRQNIEEYWFYNPLYFKFIAKKYRKKSVFGGAQVLLTVCVAAIYLANYFIANQTLQTATAIVALSLFVNGIQHCACSLRFKKILPGTVTGLFLLIPSSTMYFVLLRQDTGFTFLNLIQWSLLSVVAMLVAIQLSLRISYLLQNKRNLT